MAKLVEALKPAIKQVMDENNTPGKKWISKKIFQLAKDIVPHSLGTTRKAVAALLAEGYFEQAPNKGKVGFHYLLATENKALLFTPQNDKDRGWKSRVVRAIFEKANPGNFFYRDNLAKVLETDGKGTNTLVAKIAKQLGTKIVYDKDKRTYTF